MHRTHLSSTTTSPLCSFVCRLLVVVVEQHHLPSRNNSIELVHIRTSPPYSLLVLLQLQTVNSSTSSSSSSTSSLQAPHTMACECLLGQLGRFLICTLLAGGCVCSYYAAQSCEFFSYVSQDPELLPEPFRNVTAATVGLFGSYVDYGCTHYEHQFAQASGEGDFNAYFVTAQFAAVVGPSCAALAWVINMIEWMVWSNQTTYVLVVLLLMLGFTMQGLTFMIYGQKEFCFDDRISEECSMEFGAYMSIGATSAFYMAAIVWCCMPRSDPFCIAKGNKNNKQAPMSQEDEDTYAKFYNQTSGDQSVTTNHFNTFGTGESVYPTNSNINDEDNYYNTSSRNVDAANVKWADSNNRGPIPQQQSKSSPQELYQKDQAVDEVDWQPAQPPSFEQPLPFSSSQQQQQRQHPDPPAFQDHTSSWTAHETTEQQQQEPFANPFVLDDSSSGAAQRPAYGNLQG